MTEIKLKVTDQHLRAVVYPLIASGGINENRITVEFEGTEWTGYVCGVAFNTDEDPDTIYTQNLNSNNQCIVPWEVTEKAGTLFVAVFGTATSDVKRTTEVTAITIVDGAGNGNAIPAPPTPTVYDQLVALINTKQDLLVSGTNIKTVNNNSLLGSGNVDIESIYWVKFGTTTFSDIYNAMAAKKLPVIYETSGAYYYPYDIPTSSPNKLYFFNVSYYNSSVRITLIYIDTSNTWYTYHLNDLQEKLVSGTNIKTINNTSLLGSGDISISGGSDLFECTFGTTTYAEITQALSDGKLPYCIFDNRFYIYYSNVASTYYFSSYSGSNTGLRITCYSGGWTTASTYSIETSSNKVTSISSSSTNAQYPSAKCVYDAISAITTSGLAEFKVTLTTANYSSGAYAEAGPGLRSYSKFFVMPDPYYFFGKYYASDMRFEIQGSTFYAYTGSYQSVDLHIVIYAYN